MKRVFIFLFGLAMVFGLSMQSHATLKTIGTANYLGNDWNLIYEDDQGLVWLDYRKAIDTWQNQVAWASALGGSLTVTLDPGYTTSIDWTTGWRLPNAGVDPQVGFNQTTSEMGHLYYVSLHKPEGGPLGNTNPFGNLENYNYWSDTSYSSDCAWYFNFNDGNQTWGYKIYYFYAWAVRPGNVSTVPEPGILILLGISIMSVAGLRRWWRE